MDERMDGWRDGEMERWRDGESESETNKKIDGYRWYISADKDTYMYTEKETDQWKVR